MGFLSVMATVEDFTPLGVGALGVVWALGAVVAWVEKLISVMPMPALEA